MNALVRNNLDRGSPEATVYALEILDLVVSAELKPMVLPVVEELSPFACLKRLDPFFYQERTSRAERLSAIVNRDSNRIGLWPKACALYAMGRLSEGGVPPDLVANLFHPDPLIRQVAAGSIYTLSPADYAKHTSKLEPEEKQELDRLIMPEREAMAETWVDRTLFGRVRLLHSFSKGEGALNASQFLKARMAAYSVLRWAVAPPSTMSD